MTRRKRTDFHETYTEPEAAPPSERSTGLVFAAVSAIVGAVFWRDMTVLAVCAALCLTFVILSLAAPALLRPLNLAWFRFSLVLNRIVNPVILGLMFLVAILPFGLIMQLWRDWLTQTERQFNALFNEAMGSEAFARSLGGYLELSAVFQRMLAEGMERYLTVMNMPSRSNVVALGETLRAIEGRLASIEETLQIAAEAADGGGRREAPPSEPARTRRPPGVPAAEETREEEAIPEELRR